MDDHLNLEALVGKKVRIDRGGPESREGRLLSVKPDHLVLDCDNEGVLYYKLHHIKSITFDSQDYTDLGIDAAYETPEYLEADSFPEVLKGMLNRWVQLNRGGPERLEGVLIDCGDNHCQLVVNNEVVHISNFHLRNVSYAAQNQETNREEEQNRQQNQQQESRQANKHHSSGKSSGKKNSGKATKRIVFRKRKIGKKMKK